MTATDASRPLSVRFGRAVRRSRVRAVCANTLLAVRWLAGIGVATRQWWRTVVDPVIRASGIVGLAFAIGRLVAASTVARWIVRPPGGTRISLSDSAVAGPIGRFCRERREGGFGKIPVHAWERSISRRTARGVATAVRTADARLVGATVLLGTATWLWLSWPNLPSVPILGAYLLVVAAVLATCLSWAAGTLADAPLVSLARALLAPPSEPEDR